MKVFVYQEDTDLSVFFERPEFAVPFLSSDLLTFFLKGVERAGLGAETYLPATWGIEEYRSYSRVELEGEGYGYVMFAPLTSLIVFDFEESDFIEMKQFPDRLFSNNGVVAGYVDYGKPLPAPKDNDTFFKNIRRVNLTTFLQYNQRLVGNLEAGEQKRFVYGSPVILTDNVCPRTTVAGPAFIGEHVRIENSYIGPGSVITGTSVIENSTILHSFINSSTVENSEFKDSLITDSSIEGVHTEDSRLPFGSVIRNIRKI